MSLTDRERKILKLRHKGLTDYKISRKIKIDPKTATRSRKNAEKKLAKAGIDVEWARKIGIQIINL